MKYLPLAFLTFSSEISSQEANVLQSAGIFDHEGEELIPTTKPPGTIMPAPGTPVEREKTNIALILAHHKATLKEHPELLEEQSQEGLGARAFSGSIGTYINSIHEYGCWCYFYEYGRGKGEPVDGIDEQCRVLQYGYECAIRDGEDEGSFCTPWEVAYNSAVGGTGMTILEECTQNNPADTCAIRACTVEGSFIANLLDVFVAGAETDLAYKHENGFDPDVSCGVGNNRVDAFGQGDIDPSDISCCGYYPDRKPFNTQHGDRACCFERTYSTLTLNCCPDGRVKANC